MAIVANVPLLRTLVVRPVGGQFNHDPAEELSIHQSPDMVNCSIRQGMLLKRPGRVQFPDGAAAMDTAVIGLYSTQDEENNTYLYAVTFFSVYRFDSATDSWVKLTGPVLTANSLSSVTFETSQNSVVFANGHDPVMRIVFTTDTYAILSPNCPVARYVTRFANRLYIGYTVEGGLSKPYRIRRCVASDHFDWTGVGSGFTDLDEFPYQVRGIRKLGARMGVYSERSINLAARTEIAAAPARFDIQSADVGVFSPHTLVGWKDEHFFLGTDDFYKYNGVQPTELSLPVRDTLFEILNPSALLRNFAVARYDTKEYIAFVCTGAAVVPNEAWLFNKQREVWYPWHTTGAKCATEHRLDDTLTIDELIGTIDEQNWEFDTRLYEAQYPAMLTGHEDGKVYLWAFDVKSDAGSDIQCRWTSKDFTARDVHEQFANNKVTLKHLVVSYRDQGANFTLDFEYSTDGGGSWGSADTILFTSAGTTTRMLDKFITRQVTGNKIRFRFRHASNVEGFAIVSFHVSLEVVDAPLYS